MTMFIRFIKTIVAALLVAVGLATMSPACNQDAESAALNRSTEELVAALNWVASADAASAMTHKGMADYCVQQIRIAGHAGDFYQDPSKSPLMDAVTEVCTKYGIEAHRIAEVPSIFAQADVAANLKVYHESFRRESSSLARKLTPDQLKKLTQEICQVLANLDPKPNTYVTSNVTLVGSQAQVAIGLKPAGQTDAQLAEALPTNGESCAALRCRFVSDSEGWKFDGFNVEKILEDQLKLLNSIDLRKVYVPNELRNSNLLDSSSRWSLARSRQSEHCIVFWAKGYGHLDPNSPSIPDKFRVDVDELLSKAEKFFHTNVEKLKFADVREGKSQLAKYKLQIYLLHTDEWVAAGAGSDDVVGGLWVSPMACQPVGSTIAHEIGHCFQYQVHCDLKGKHGFRYGFGGNGGNSFWEQTAQWQALQDFPNEIFGGRDFAEYLQNHHRHFHHEDQRYASYFLPFYWQQKHGDDIIARVWRGALQPEDPIEAYMRITGVTVSQFNDEFYDAAVHFATWDLDALRHIGRPYINYYTHSLQPSENGFSRVSYSRCPGTTGYNVIELSVPSQLSSIKSHQVTAEFRAIRKDPRYNPQRSDVVPGWRYGFVALNKDGTRTYGAMHRNSASSIEYQLPSTCERLWLVVTGAPDKYRPHAWDDNEKNDDQWPYEVKLTGTEFVRRSETDN